ncbi:prepilin peptidase [Amphritea japonica]|uniref:Prepilin leader peptidase/N-methyltransferase n=1 Tax=Amphritea japonica ATCC BAA-1530 TaxID=1278309 RepID=A0A7R6PAE9_9GAMM|nr:A24 family peptidase [Amphritea japonica]BBB25521.1 leader peptidase (prepilin peptidase)/N-methyltransferase [Amphritea japonica ATCC BAA-1530]
MLFELIAANTWLSVSVAFGFALLIGSFLNVVIHRLPLMMEHEWQLMAAEAANNNTTDTGTTEHPKEPATVYNLAQPASTCPTCGHLIHWYENIPLISYFLILGGKCSSCKTPISLRYPLIELITAAISAAIIYLYGFNLVAFSIVFFSWCLIALTAIDIDHQLLPDKITLPLLWIGLILNSFDYFTSLPSALWGAVLGYLSLWSVYWLFKLITGKEGMGYGDFKLLAALGAWAGADMLPLIILASSLIGAVVGGLMIAFSRHESQTPIPFGPYLAGAGWIALLWGHDLTDWYLQLLNF